APNDLPCVSPVMPQVSSQDQRRPHTIGRSIRGGRDPSRRRTRKPHVKLEHASETAILRSCMDTIGECFQYCLSQGGDHVESEHLRCMLDAWDLLNATAT